MKKKILTFIAALAILLGGGFVGFAAGGGFFDNAGTVQDNIVKLANMVTNRDKEIKGLESKISQNQNDQDNLNSQIVDLKNQLENKTREVTNKQEEVAAKQKEIEAKQQEINQKQQEVNKKQQEADSYKQQLDQLRSESAQKDAKMAELAKLSQDKVNELDNK